MGSKLEHHRSTLGALHLALGVSDLLALAIITGVFGGVMTIAGEPIVTDVLGTIGGVAAVILVLSAFPCVLAGYALLREQPWARTAALISAILALPALPLGTGVAIYTLWVLGEDLDRSAQNLSQS